ncbi:hypothetical protein K8S19_06825 [bacterium]|nr:hypothetical protein [bacterium]
MNSVDRILDANLNRAREGLRVVEEWIRLDLENKPLQQRLKAIRHALIRAENKLPGKKLIASRDVKQDPGAAYSTAGEKRRRDPEELLRANLRRVQEAARVLEEVSKLKGGEAGKVFKKIRFQIYNLEYDIVHKMTSHRKLKRT